MDSRVVEMIDRERDRRHLSWLRHFSAGGVVVPVGGFWFLNERSTPSSGSVDTGWSRQSQRIISGKMAPPCFWPWFPMPQVEVNSYPFLARASTRGTVW